MRLSDFILSNVEPILVEWEAYARSIWPGAAVEPAELRDHAEGVLYSLARDMKTSQTEIQRGEKSKGQSDRGEQGAPIAKASELHASERHASGFDLIAMISEYRALRASVLRLWRDSDPQPDVNDLDDLVRFNESMDQAITEAVRSFTDRVTRSRQLFLAILGHDLRNPLGAMMLTGQILAKANLKQDLAELASRIPVSAGAMGKLLDDLLDFTGTELTGTLSLSPTSMDLGNLCDEVVQETRSAHPDCKIAFKREGELVGNWDRTRMRQVVSNLLVNAAQHGSPGSVVDLTVTDEGPNVKLTVHNTGSPIPPDSLQTIFQPMARGPQAGQRHGSIGLGLYITRAVVVAHSGTIDVTSSAKDGTVFTVNLPRTRDKR